MTNQEDISSAVMG